MGPISKFPTGNSKPGPQVKVMRSSSSLTQLLGGSGQEIKSWVIANPNSGYMYIPKHIFLKFIISPNYSDSLPSVIFHSRLEDGGGVRAPKPSFMAQWEDAPVSSEPQFSYLQNGSNIVLL